MLPLGLRAQYSRLLCLFVFVCVFLSSHRPRQPADQWKDVGRSGQDTENALEPGLLKGSAKETLLNGRNSKFKLLQRKNIVYTRLTTNTPPFDPSELIRFGAYPALSLDGYEEGRVGRNS